MWRQITPRQHCSCNHLLNLEACQRCCGRFTLDPDSQISVGLAFSPFSRMEKLKTASAATLFAEGLLVSECGCEAGLFLLPVSSPAGTGKIAGFGLALTMDSRPGSRDC